MITRKWTVAIVLLISTVESLRAQVRNTDEDLPNATGEFTNAQSENDRANAQLLAMKLRFRLEFSAKPTQNDGPSEVSWVNWDGENLIVDSERFVYVSTPYRAFLLTRDKAANPLSIQFITPISPEKRSVEDIIKFDLKVGDGYVAASRPTELRRYNCQYGTYNPRDGAAIERATRLSNGSLRFDYRRIANPDEFLVREEGFCIVDPAQGYSVVSSQMGMVYKRANSNSTMQSQFEYFPPQGDLPRLMKSYKHKQVPSSGSKNTPHFQHYTYSNYAIEPVPKEKLTLEYYGLPDPMKSPRSFWGWPAALIGSGLLAIVLYFAVRHRRRRLQ